MYRCHEMAVVIRVTYGQAGSLVGSDISGSLKDQDPHASVRLRAEGLPQQNLRVPCHDVVGKLTHNLITQTFIQAPGSVIE
jgi:hypothetical protein